MKQSSIDWLIEQLTVVERNLVNKTYLQNNNTLAGHNLRELFKQAKSMHKDEIENAYDDGWHHNNEDFYNPVGYYNETFNTKEKLHTEESEFIQISQDNPVTKGSTALIRNL